MSLGPGREEDPRAPMGQEQTRSSAPLVQPGDSGPVTPTSSPEEVAAYLFVVVAAPILAETPQQEIRTGNDVADFLAENKLRVEKVYEETLLTFLSDPPAAQIMTVNELVDGLWPKSAADILGLLYEHIQARVAAE